MSRALDVATSFAASVARGGSGMAVGTLGPRPARRLELYEFEACPFCRKVREALSILDLEAMIYPCPKGGPALPRAGSEPRRQGALPLAGRPEHRREMYESDDIVRYLFATYGDGRVPALLALPVVRDLTSGLASAFRIGLGDALPPRPAAGASRSSSGASRRRPSAASPARRSASLELPYVLHNVAKGSPGREAFVTRSGKMMVPYLVDPNTGVSMFESADIVAYLDRTYALDGTQRVRAAAAEA